MNPPDHNIEAEQKLLCCMIMDEFWNDKIEEVYIESQHFYKSEHEVLFNVIEKLHDKSIHVDFTTISDGLRRVNAESIIRELPNILNSTSTTVGIEHYAKIIKEKYIKRNLLFLCSEIISNMHNTESKHLIEQLDSKIYELTETKNRGKFENVDQLVVKQYEELQRRCESGNKLKGIPTTYTKIDNVIGGFSENKLMILAGRPGTFKTTLALEFGNRIAQNEKGHVAFFSLEMTKGELVDRQLANAGNVSIQDIKNGNLDDESWGKMALGMDKVSKYRMAVNDSTQSLNSIRREARKLKRKNGTNVIIIDYLGFLDINQDKNENKASAVGKISRGLKGITKELKLTVLLLCQLNRECEKRPDKKPITSDLKDSGDIEQDADTIAMLYNPSAYDIRTFSDGVKTYEYPENYIEVLVTKNRDGATGSIAMIKKAEYMQLFEMEGDFQGV